MRTMEEMPNARRPRRKSCWEATRRSRCVHKEFTALKPVWFCMESQDIIFCVIYHVCGRYPFHCRVIWIDDFEFQIYKFGITETGHHCFIFDVKCKCNIPAVTSSFHRVKAVSPTDVRKQVGMEIFRATITFERGNSKRNTSTSIVNVPSSITRVLGCLDFLLQGVEYFTEHRRASNMSRVL